MVTTPQDYQSLLYRIQDSNRQTQAILLPKDEIIYDINLNKRSIQAPEFLSVQDDHRAETLYFKADRYIDNMDLADPNITCIVQYNNADPDKNKRGYIYAVPFVDIETLKDEQKILFPWVIEGPATAFPGTVEFAVQFYKLDATGHFVYNLNTIPSQSKVLHGMDIREASENYNYDASTIDEINDRINKIAAMQDLYWIDAY